MLRQKFSSQEAVRQKFTGKDSFGTAVRMGNLRNKGSDRIDGAVKRSEADMVERALSRKARKTGKDVSIRRNFNYDSTEMRGNADIQKTRFEGSAKRGGDDRYGQKAQKQMMQQSASNRTEQRMRDVVAPGKPKRLKRSTSDQSRVARGKARQTGAFGTAKRKQRDDRLFRNF